MPKASNMTVINKPQKVLVYGPPKSGKTELVARLAENGFDLYWFDLENGSTTILNRLSQEGKEHITIFPIPDTKAVPRAIEIVSKVAADFHKPVTYKICDKHGKVFATCQECSKSNTPFFTELPLTELQTNRQSVLVIDSFTQLDMSAKNYIANKGNALKSGDFLEGFSKFEFDDWAFLGWILGNVLGAIQGAPMHVVVISHEDEVEMIDDSKKIVPAGGTRNAARNNAKYFDHVVYCMVENRKHKALSAAIESPRLQLGTRSGLDLKQGATLADLLNGKYSSVVDKDEDGSGSGTEEVQKKTTGLLSKLDKKLD